MGGAGVWEEDPVPGVIGRREGIQDRLRHSRRGECSEVRLGAGMSEDDSVNPVVSAWQTPGIVTTSVRCIADEGRYEAHLCWHLAKPYSI
jgi:hypothetical protein